MKVSRRQLLKTASIAGAGAAATARSASLLDSGRTQENLHSTPGELPAASTSYNRWATG